MCFCVYLGEYEKKNDFFLIFYFDFCVKVFEGERFMIKDNNFFGCFEFMDIVLVLCGVF